MNPRHHSGTAAEYLAAAWFLRSGYQVWWPAIQQSRSDFAVSKDGEFQKVQVKKATWAFSGTNEYLSTRLKSRRTQGGRLYDIGDFDLLAVIDDDSRIWIIPFDELPRITSLALDKRGPTAGSYNVRTYDPSRWRVM